MKRDFFVVATWEQNGCDCKSFDTYHETFRDVVYMARQFARFYGSYCEYNFVYVTVYDEHDNIVFEA